MLAYMCKNCGQFTIRPLVNEFNEHFCNEDCYKNFCERRHYTIHLDRLKEVNYVEKMQNK